MERLPEAAYAQLTPDLRICRVLNGMWQVSGSHGTIEPAAAIAAMLAYHDAGFTTWDLADHYGPAEDFIASFRRELVRTHGAGALRESQAFTKWVPRPGPMTRRIVEGAVDVSLRRMGVTTLDLLQFHWWEYGDLRYLDALRLLDQLRQEGKIRHLALTNFDTEHLRLVVQQGIPIISNQVQYSLVDRRPERKMAAFCREHGIQLLAYGVLAGGLLSDRYLGQPEPTVRQLNTASLRKYKQMIDAWGGWELFQRLLVVLKHVADRHAASIANIAVRAILDRPAVGGTIVGARLGLSAHISDTAPVFAIHLGAADHSAVGQVLDYSSDLEASIGDCGAEYRR